MNQDINKAFMRFSRRAEANEQVKLVETFVDVGPLFTLLSSSDHQIIFGRRGTGKTHAVTYLAQAQQGGGAPVAYIDLRTIGSSGGMYADQWLPIHERATRLLSDMLAALHDKLVEFFVEYSEEYDLSYTGPLLDELAEDISNVCVVGTIEIEESNSQALSHSKEHAVAIESGPDYKPKLKWNSGKNTGTTEQAQNRTTQSGELRHSIHFGAVRKTLGKLVDVVEPRKIWVLLDEWSSIPLDLQPFLGDFLRRSLMSVRGIVVKIVAIEQRARFKISLDSGNYIGIEVGADIAGGRDSLRDSDKPGQ